LGGKTEGRGNGGYHGGSKPIPNEKSVNRGSYGGKSWARSSGQMVFSVLRGSGAGEHMNQRRGNGGCPFLEMYPRNMGKGRGRKPKKKRVAKKKDPKRGGGRGGHRRGLALRAASCKGIQRKRGRGREGERKSKGRKGTHLLQLKGENHEERRAKKCGPAGNGEAEERLSLGKRTNYGGTRGEREEGFMSLPETRPKVKS